MSRTFILFFVIFGLCLSASAQVAPETQPLVPGQPVERQIAGGQSHAYRLTLQAGQFVRVVAEQRGIDVKLALAGPDGKPLIESDLTDIIGATEPLSYEAAAAGTYKIVVRANGAATRSGAYVARLEVKASASVQDRKRITAESLLNETGLLFDQGRSADPQMGEKLGQALGLSRELEDPRSLLAGADAQPDGPRAYGKPPVCQSDRSL